MATAKKKKGKLGRPEGTNNVQRTTKRIIDSIETIRERVSYDMVDAYATLVTLMNDKKASHTVRKGSSEAILKVGKTFFDTIEGKSTPSTTGIDDIEVNEPDGEVIFLELTHKEDEEE